MPSKNYSTIQYNPLRPISILPQPAPVLPHKLAQTYNLQDTSNTTHTTSNTLNANPKLTSTLKKRHIDLQKRSKPHNHRHDPNHHQLDQNPNPNNRITPSQRR
ncbi:hypothetical protein KC19_9G025900 [Ceratodon purpureus]|uniref:Uncharacterized protein n=1 Tax=Ceratodon purpureus TaxID=3225 RepID=A0A8T0GRZ8_CERPU|nr:hypothetical protein KC19_9G025900 [Ceratodon purpureus]